MCVGHPVPLNVPINCEGAEKDRSIGRIERKTKIRFTFQEPRRVYGATHQDGNAAWRGMQEERPARQREVEIVFCELDRLADPIIIGCPDLHQWGMFLEPIEDPRSVGWVQFTQWGGLSLPLAGARRGNKINVIHPVLLTGPDYVTVKVQALRQEVQHMVE